MTTTLLAAGVHIARPATDWMAVMPEVVLAIAAIVVLLVGLLPGAWVRWALPVLSIAGLAIAAGVAFDQFSHVRLHAWGGQVDADPTANLVRVLAAFAGIVTVLFSVWSRPERDREGEHYALLLAAVCGMGLFGAAGSLVSLFVGLELFSIALYVLCALDAERERSLESGLKYLIIGGLSSAVLLYGAALVYGDTGTFELARIGASPHRGMLLAAGAAMLIAALGFKASAAPLHWWTPDVYDGAPTTVTAFMATATKAAAFLATARVLVVAFFPEAHTWQAIVAALAVASIVVGNLGAIVQQRLKRMLAYSSIAHAGYLLIGIVGWRTIGIAALGYALAVYVAMTLGAFALVLLRERQVNRDVTYDDLAGTGWSVTPGATWLGALPGIAMVLLMLSLAGIPPTGGFFAKFGLFDAAVENGYAWLAVVGVVGSAVSLVYYLRVVVAMYMQPGDADTARFGAGREFAPFAVLGVALAALTLALGFAPNRVLHRACEGRASLGASSGLPANGCAPRVAAARR